MHILMYIYVCVVCTNIKIFEKNLCKKLIDYVLSLTDFLVVLLTE